MEEKKEEPRWKTTSLKEAMEIFKGKVPQKPLTQEDILARGDSWLGKK